jgi:hypothetical protein
MWPSPIVADGARARASPAGSSPSSSPARARSRSETRPWTGRSDRRIVVASRAVTPPPGDAPVTIATTPSPHRSTGAPRIDSAGACGSSESSPAASSLAARRASATQERAVQAYCAPAVCVPTKRTERPVATPDAGCASAAAEPAAGVTAAVVQVVPPSWLHRHVAVAGAPPATTSTSTASSAT